MSHVVMIRGLPASGKTMTAYMLIQNWYGFTHYSRENLYLISKDDIRRSLCYGKMYGSCDLYLVEEIRDAMLQACLRKNYDVVFDETFIEIEDMNRVLCQIDETHHVMLVDKTNVPVLELIERDKAREHGVGISVIRDAYQRMKEHNKRMDELVRPFDEVVDERTMWCTVTA